MHALVGSQCRATQRSPREACVRPVYVLSWLFKNDYSSGQDVIAKRCGPNDILRVINGSRHDAAAAAPGVRRPPALRRGAFHCSEILVEEPQLSAVFRPKCCPCRRRIRTSEGARTKGASATAGNDTNRIRRKLWASRSCARRRLHVLPHCLVKIRRPGRLMVAVIISES